MEILDLIRSIGFVARQNNVTLSVYPDSTNTLISNDDLIINKTIEELNFHSWFFESAGCPSNPSNPIIVKPFKDPPEASHTASVELVRLFYKNFKTLNKETQKRVVFQNESSGFWNPINLFKYFHVYLNEKYGKGMVLSYDNIADSRKIMLLK